MKYFVSMLLLLVTGRVTAMGTRQALPNVEGVLGGSCIPSLAIATILLLMIVFGIFWIAAVVRVIKAMQVERAVAAAIVTLILLFLVAPVGVIVAFAALHIPNYEEQRHPPARER